MTAESQILDLKSKFKRAAREGSGVAGLLERGQAQTPLADHFAVLERELAEDSFGIILLGLTSEARGAALGWLLGDETRLLSVHVPSAVGLVEITLQSTGYILERGDGGRQEFDRLDHFLEALKDADLVRSGDEQAWLNPLRLRIAANPGLQGLHIYMPECPAAVLDNPGLMGRIVSGANLMIVAAPEGHEVSDEERAAVCQIGEAIDVLWPLVLPREGAPAAGARPWHADPRLFRRDQTLPHSAIDLEGKTTLPSLLVDPRHPLREALFLHHLVRRLEAGAEMVAERQSQESRQASSRQAAMSRQLKASEELMRGGEGEMRPRIDAIRTGFQLELAQLSEGIRESNRKSLAASGRLAAVVQTAIDGLGVADLAEERARTVTKLTIDPQFVDDVVRRLRRTARDLLREDLIMTRDGVAAVREKAEAKLAEVCGNPVTLRMPAPDEQILWDAMKDSLETEVRYRGELPNRSFFQRLSAGRQQAYMILMLLSLFGGAASLRRSTLFTVLMVGLFFGGFAYTYVGWRRDDAERLENEVEKVTGTLKQELQRNLQNLQREKATRLSAYFTDLGKEVQGQVEALTRDAQGQRKAGAERESGELRGRLRSVESRARELGNHAQQIGRFRQTCGDLQRDVSGLERSLIREEASRT